MLIEIRIFFKKFLVPCFALSGWWLVNEEFEKLSEKQLFYKYLMNA